MNEQLNLYIQRQVAIGSQVIPQQETLAKIKCHYGLIYSQSEPRLSADKSAVSVPLDYFLLM